jgi:Pseudouridylate synthase
MTCSRTDRGVSALMNTASLDTDLPPVRIMGTLNAHLDHIYFHRYAIVNDNFRVRYVAMKTYGYILPDTYPYNHINLDDLKHFEGVHNFERYCKLDGKKQRERSEKSLAKDTWIQE